MHVEFLLEEASTEVTLEAFLYPKKAGEAWGLTVDDTPRSPKADALKKY